MASPFVSSMVNDFGIYGSKQLGENGAVEFTASGLATGETRKSEGYLTAMFSKVMRNVSQSVIEEYVDNFMRSKDWTRDDLNDLFSLVFHTRECRGDGKGERDVFYHFIFVLYKYYPNTVKSLLELVPDYGYWKDFQNMIRMTYEDDNNETMEFRNTVYKIWVDQLKMDVGVLRTKGGDISLASKYFPKEGRSLDKKYRVCEQMARMYFNDYQTLKETILKRMRKEVISPLTKEIGIIERMMSNNEWDNIKFNLVPGRCLSINRKAFMNVKKDNSQRSSDETRIQCSKNYCIHMSEAMEGKAVVHGKQMFLYELISMYMKCNNFTCRLNNLRSEEDMMVNAQWNDHKKYYEDMIKGGSGLDRTMVLADFSGSMTGDPMKVAASMAIMVSSLLPKPWRNKFISFESRPQLLEIPEGGLYEKLNYVLNSPWGGNTDFIAAIQLILKVGIDNKLKREEMPDKLIVVSDMQFDSACKYDRYSDYSEFNYFSGRNNTIDMKNKTTHDWIRSAFENAGRQICGEPWEPPKMVYWNVSDRNGGFPVQSDTPNTQMLAGYSLSLLKLVLDNGDLKSMKKDTPYETMLKAVRNERYDPVRRVVNDVNEVFV